MPWAAAIGAAASYYGAQQQNKAAKASAKGAWKRSVYSYKRRYQWQMDDMRRAGLNPILAYQNPPPGGPVGVPYQPVNEGAAMVQGADIASGAALKRATTGKVSDERARLRADTSAVRAATASMVVATLE